MTCKPLLSICIPTYNRAEYLKKSLESLVGQESFSEIEVVISDNCSTDNTQEVIAEFQKVYPNIAYFRNEENIRDRNYPTVMMRAHGVFRKLCNDNLLYKEGTISYFLKALSENANEKPCIFFLNGSKPSESSDFICVNFNELMYAISYFVTWIGGFGLWEEDCTNLKSELNIFDTQLWQTYKFLADFAKRKKCLVLNKKMVGSFNVANKDLTYGIFKIFHDNYLNLLSPYINSGVISPNCLEWLKKDLLFNHFSVILLNWEIKNKLASYNSDNLKKIIFEGYSKEPYFKEFKSYYNKQKWQNQKVLFITKVKSKISDSLLGKLLLPIKRMLHIKLY